MQTAALDDNVRPLGGGHVVPSRPRAARESGALAEVVAPRTHRRFRFANLRISARLGAGFGVVAVLLVLMSALGWTSASSWSSSAAQSHTSLLKVRTAGNLQQDALSLALAENSVAADFTGHVSASADLASFRSARTTFLADERVLAALPLSAEHAALLHQAMTAFDGYVALSDQINALFTAGTRADVRQALNDVAALAASKITQPLQQLAAGVVSHSQGSVKSTQSSANSTRMLTLLGGVLALVLSLGIVLLVERSVKKPIDETVAVLKRVAGGDLTVTAGIDTTDEIGQMASALDEALVRLRDTMGSIGEHSRSLASASEELSSVSTQMAGSADETSAQAGVVSATAEQLSSGVQTIATGTEEMSASIKEISRSANEATRIASEGVVVARATNETVSRLGGSMAEVGDIVKVITTIAEQTNLLALNATIEAARAGEAGKGFAIVANEVKDLARQTAGATDDIAVKIEAIQTGSLAVAESMGDISRIMEQINEAQATIASAVEEQAATTGEIGRTLSEAATGTGDIARNIAGFASAARDTTSGAADTQRAAAELARMAGELDRLVGQFSY